MSSCKKCGKVIVNPTNCSTRYDIDNKKTGTHRKYLQAIARFRRKLCAKCYKTISKSQKESDERDVARWEAE